MAARCFGTGSPCSQTACNCQNPHRLFMCAGLCLSVAQQATAAHACIRYFPTTHHRPARSSRALLVSNRVIVLQAAVFSCTKLCIARCCLLLACYFAHLQAVKIMCMVFVLWGVMWCFGLMPYQQDPLLLEQRMQQMAQARQQQQQQQGVAAGGGHTEL